MQLQELDQEGKRQALADYITNLDTGACPVSSMIPKERRPNQGIVMFQTEKYPTSGFRGVPEGKDVDAYNSQTRKTLFARRQRFWWNPSVSTEAEANVVAGESAGEMARQKRTALVVVKRQLEGRILSFYDSQEPKAQDEVGGEFRGLGEFIKATAQADLPVHADFLTPAASIFTGTIDTFTEGQFKLMLQSIYKVRKARAKLDFFGGITAKSAFSEFAGYADNVSNKTPTRHLNLDMAERKLITVVEKIVTDSAEVDLHPSSFIGLDQDTGADTAYTHTSGYLLDMEFLALAYTVLPRIRDLEDRGGGPRAICELMATFLNKNPQAHGKLVSTLANPPVMLSSKLSATPEAKKDTPPAA